MSEHTKGRWETSVNCEHDVKTIEVICFDEKGDIAEIASCELNQNGEANAQLIASAPKLLRALKELVAICPENLVGGYQLLIENGEDAINEAEEN